jgi:divinyl chlorophyllide a 8-vinyl-reductase
MLLGASGTIGRATAQALLDRGHDVVTFGRAPRGGSAVLPAGLEQRHGDVTDLASVTRDGFRGERFDALVSCLASRTGDPRDAWAIDHRAHRQALQAARAAGVIRVVLLSALCVQKPRLAFQHAKLAFEQELQRSGLDWTIVRPTAFFKSLSGQVARVQAGRPFLVFGDGRLTACKPIADADLADYLADTLDDPSRIGRILPIGGPGPAITPLDQAHRLFELLGQPSRIRRVPVALIDGIAGALGLAARVVPALQAKAEFARIGRYYATESMLVLDPTTGRYDADATPSFGTRTLWDHYAALLRGDARAALAEHAVFDRRPLS